jgi:hypothetical protein
MGSKPTADPKDYPPAAEACDQFAARREELLA